MYTFGFKWFEKPLWAINIKFYDVIVTDMLHKYRIRSLKEFYKMLFWTVLQYPQESVGDFY